MLLTSTGFPVLSTTTARNSASWLSSTSGSLGEGSRVVQSVLEVDITGGSEVELFSVREVQVLLGLITCEGCDVVGCDHAPQSWSSTGGLTWTSRCTLRWTSGRAGRRTVRRGRKRRTQGRRQTTQDTNHKCACMDDMDDTPRGQS